jgi:putative transposase
LPVICDGERYVITHILSLESVLAKSQDSGKSETLKISDLAVIEDTQGDSEVRDLVLVSEEEWKEALKWFKIIEPLIDSPRRTQKMVAEAARAANVGTSTLYKKLAKYEETGRVSSLITTKSSGGKGKSRLSPEAEAILSATIQEVYLDKQKPSLEHTYKAVKRAFRAANLIPPHYNTIRNRVKSIPEKEKDEGRLGKQVAAKKHSAFPGRFPGADWPLAVVQIDHTQFNVMLLDDIYRLLIGKPWVTLIIDVFSRMVLGYYISPDRPNSMSVGLCIASAILPKEKTLAKFNISTSWPCWGFMTKIHADNAGEFRGKMLRRACAEYSIDLEWRPVKTPHYGAHIERLLGTILKEVHSLPGTTFSNIKERGEYDSEGNAIMTYSEFEAWLLTYITGVYHQRLHSSLLTSPVKQYERGILGTDEIIGRGFPRKAVDEERLKLDLMPFYERTIQGNGIRINWVHYYSDVLRRYVNAHDPDNPKRKRQFTFRRMPNDISVTYFYDPDVKQYYKVPYRDTSLPPMSEWDFRAARERLIKQGKDDTNERLIAESYEQMREIQEKAAIKTKSARRAQQRRIHNKQIEQPSLSNALPIEGATQDTEKSLSTDSTSIVIEPFDEIEFL